mmetsp:Transcript_38325/g.43225  ORF Transcript_38325/g.43225 Transcript_38325/m.43225 type:complete len:947 (-) Transcript_38325:236-3076(-)
MILDRSWTDNKTEKNVVTSGTIIGRNDDEENKNVENSIIYSSTIRQKESTSPLLSSSSSSSNKLRYTIGSLTKCLYNFITQFVLIPMYKLLKLKLPIYVIFLGTIGVVLISQCIIMYSTHSIFMKLNDVMDAIHPMQSILLNSTVRNNYPNDNSPFVSNTIVTDFSTGEEGDDEFSVTGGGVAGGNSEESNPYNVGAKEGIFFSNISYNYRECTSPESHVPWPLEGDVHSKTSSLSCGMKSNTSMFTSFFQGNLWKRKYEPLMKRCKRLVVFGVAFGGNFVKDLDAPHVRSLVNATDLLRRHGRCFFILTTEEDIRNNADIIEKYNNIERDFIDPVTIGHNILIPIPRDVLPYHNPRRNVKLLKYMGQYMFQESETIIWQDAKFFRDDFVSKQPIDYEDLIEKDSCVMAMGLPVHKITVGLDNIRKGIQKNGRYRAQYEHHCQTIIAALIERPNVTDSSENLIRQCDSYLQHVYQQEGNIETMNQGLIDSAFIVWNHRTQSCRDFSSAFRCTIMDQIQCHSDRDQVSIPFAMYTMGVSGMYSQRKGENVKVVDESWDPRIHDLDFVVSDDQTKNLNSKEVMLRVTRASCHWYFSRLGNCRTDLTEEKPTLALLVAGSAKRYVFDGLADHLIKPLVKEQNTKVDYYLMLSVKQGLAYRSSDAYMKYQTYDPNFAAIAKEKDSGKVTAYLFDKIRNSVSLSGANVGGIHIQNQPMKLDPPMLRKKQLEAKRARPKEDSYYRFPTLDLRPEFRRRTAVANRNLFKLYLGLQKLWEKHLIASEHFVGVSYDYVMVLREDVMWMGDFNLKRMIATNPTADAYVLSCDMRDPPIIANEYNDYGIVIKREKADVVGRYFDQILKTDLNACHKSVKDMAANHTGCNSGMLFYWIMDQNNVTVQRVPQSLFPIERAVNLAMNKTSNTCIHRYCQSKEDPLQVLDNLQICTNMKLS